MISEKEIRNCKVCKHSWESNLIFPTSCPNCHSRNYDHGNNLKCRICQKNVLIPHIHHVDGNHKNNKEENRIPVCSLCHRAIHSGFDHLFIKSGGKTATKNFKLKSIKDIDQLRRLKIYSDKLKGAKIINLI